MGFDSLQTIELAGGLRAVFENFMAHDMLLFSISPKTIYAHSNVQSLSSYLYSLVGKRIPKVNSDQDLNEHRGKRDQRMQNLVRKHTGYFHSRVDPPKLTNETFDCDRRYQVILTGTTGTLGVWLLHTLLSDENISKVYCLDRSVNARERNIEGFLQRTWKLRYWMISRNVSSYSPHLGFQVSG